MNIYKRLAKREETLRKIASMPNDSHGWRDLRKRTAREACKEIDSHGELLVYLRDADDGGAELCISRPEGYEVFKLSDGMLINIALKAVKVISKRIMKNEINIPK